MKIPLATLRAVFLFLAVAVGFQPSESSAQLADGFEISLPHGHTESVTGAAFLDERLIATCSMDSTIIIWDIDTGFPVRRIFAPDECFSMEQNDDGELILLSGIPRRGVTRTILNPFTGQMVNQESNESWRRVAPDKDAVQQLSLGSDASVSVREQSRTIVGFHDGRVEVWAMSDGDPVLLQKLRPEIQGPNGVSTGGDIVATWNSAAAQHDLRFWDKNRLRCIQAETGDSTSIASGVFVNDGAYFVTSENSSLGWEWYLVVREASSGKIVHRASTPNNQLANLTKTPGTDHIVQTHFGLTGPGVYVWRLQEEQLNLVHQAPEANGSTAIFDATRDKLYTNDFIIKGKEVAHVFDTTNGRPSGNLGYGSPDIFGSVIGMAISSDHRQLLTTTYHRVTGFCAITDLDSGKTKVLGCDGVYSTIPRHNGRQILHGLGEGTSSIVLTDAHRNTRLSSWSPEQVDEFRMIRGAASGWSLKKDSLALSADQNTVYAVAPSGAIQILEITGSDKLQPTARLLPLTDGDWAIVAGEGHYAASPGAATKLAFTKSQKAYSFDQFDLQYNRPDRVLAALGGDAKLVAGLEQAHSERLLKYGLSGDTDKLDNKKDIEVSIRNRASFTEIIRSPNSELVVDLSKPQTEGCTLSLLVNGVTQTNHAVLANTNSLVIPVNLTSGTNRIEIFAVDKSGQRSLPEMLRVYCRPIAAKDPDLYLLAVGVSDYSVDELDLEVAAKDAADVVDYFRQQEKVAYQTVHTRLLVDAKASVENIIAESEFLNQASPQDTVIVFFAGHGMLEATTLDYYFGTPDIDPTDVSKRGLSYHQIEQLFSGCQSTKRLLLMDTCFAGEVERFDIAENTDEGQQLAEGVTARSFALTQAPARRTDSKAYLRRDYFSDLRKSTGINVITASGGMEFVFALEEDSIGNGLFTHCFLKALESGEGDFDGNGRVEIGELGKYLNESLSELSDGAQRPSFREVNRYSDFAVARCRAFPKFDAVDFLKNLLNLTMRNGVEADYAALFRNPCHYFDSAKSRSVIEEEERSYHERFDRRLARLVGEPQVTPINGNTYSVRYPIHIFLHSSKEKYSVYSLQFHMETLIEQELELTVQFEEDQWLISSIEVIKSERRPNPMFKEVE